MRPVKTCFVAAGLAVLTASTGAMAQSYYDDRRAGNMPASRSPRCRARRMPRPWAAPFSAQVSEPRSAARSAVAVAPASARLREQFWAGPQVS